MSQFFPQFFASTYHLPMALYIIYIILYWWTVQLYHFYGQLIF